MEIIGHWTKPNTSKLVDVGFQVLKLRSLSHFPDWRAIFFGGDGTGNAVR
ncbi:hypothetical protein FDUTEX481_06484 [Tolypothrix sp. PCC 7601]|nr:hypothetical protein FDUTEX481_06484 [Tolypothrix sp. PCC 7601]